MTMRYLSRRLPSTRQLQCFLAVAEELNFRRAAERLHMSQPPLSRQISGLEALLRVKLFERDTHGVRLTSAGEGFEHDARRVLESLDAALVNLRGAVAAEATDVRLGLTSVIDFSLVAGLRDVLTDSGLPAGTRIEEAYSKHLVERLLSGGLDLALVGEIADPGESVQARRIALDPLMVALHADHPATERERVSFDDLGDTRLFWFPRHDNPVFHDRCERVFADHGYAPPRRPEPSEHMTLLARVAAGEGVAFLPTSLRAASRLGVVYRPFVAGLEERLSIELKLLWRTEETRMEVRNVVDVLLEAAEAGIPGDGHSRPVSTP
ncbi:LysR substrate-binding domain-containing protein [Halomonas caseinilytica]|uniref:DNA-binding transcriptional regulator, LysR family n=1 Tax=Halomonas caseinilytica TaxID=438744 RepID=A0A1M7AJN3_9GAMM|nr:LysR substrate-binding domain-containing protein [Halomonas caseinilytica]SEN59922.1 DNA-binding transcriptional regulator, LysR family [Halomonas caseinilytica]SHL42867.1 DNA-binding transcriptional regulator, LysR family [Halomonas caseinilytica]